MILLFIIPFIPFILGSPPRDCHVGDACSACQIRAPLASNCSNENTNSKYAFLFCNPRTKLIDVDSSSFLVCSEGKWTQKSCEDGQKRHFSMSSYECTDPSKMIFYAQGTSGSGRVGDICSFNTDCLSGMFCSVGQCRCLSTYIAVDSYCYEKISPSESGCFYDIQCSSVWPDSFCKSGICICPSDDMVAVKTKDGTVCVWSSESEPSCPLPSLPPPNSPSTYVLLPSSSDVSSVSIASCNPHSSSVPQDEESLIKEADEHKCATKGQSVDNSVPVDVSDVYDCIDNSKFWKKEGKNIQNHPIGVCCMNRAFTCIQPKRGESDELGSVPRWWFNSITGSCQQFLFDPNSSDVSPNNFETIDHCESFCKDTCARGNPAYLPAKDYLGQTPHQGCTTSNPCGDPYQCTEIASQSICCPSRKWICSDIGGRVKDPKRTTPYDAGMRFDQLTGESANYAFGISTRYYYNSNDGQCHPFTYNGFLGNFNNFHNQADCQVFCARLQCVHGSPLTTGSGAPQRCQRDTDCPGSHTCNTEHSVCCPTPQTLCTEPLRVGDCKQTVRQFWYNAEARTCESFQYTGCQGNNNRFSTLNECQSFCKNINAEPKCVQGKAYVDFSGRFMQCGDGQGANSCPANYECHFDGLVSGCCPSKSYTCSLQMNKGISCGSGSSYRYYYNNQLKECQSYLFLGCDGNSNNFPTSEKCQNYCEIAVCPNGGSPLRMNSKIRSCSTSDPCSSGYECTMVETNGITQKRCCPSKVSICSKPSQMGMLPKCGTGSGKIRFYFNIALQTCSSYSSNGCDSSLNSFDSLSECEDFCMGAGCAAGDSVYKDPNTNRPFLCNTALQNNCPSNYHCVLNGLTQEYLCCGSDSMGVCPSGEKVFIDSRSNSPRQCAMAADGKCPSGYLCRFSQNNHKYYCCGSTTGALCPSGRALYYNPTTSLPLQCHVSSFNNVCPTGFGCISDIPNAFQAYCCSQNPICPADSRFHLDDKTQMPTSCNREGFSFCPQGFTCQQQPETNNYYCCSGEEKGGVNDGCPPGQFAHIVDETVKECDPFNINPLSCPSDYTCQWSLKNQKYQCCGSRPIRKQKPNQIEDGCPARQFALLDKRTQKSRICTAGEKNSCPTGFFCQFSAKKSQFQCCGQSGGCPAGRAAYIAIDGNAQECLAGPDTCSHGYECVKSNIYKYKNICCSKEDNECGDNEQLIDGICQVRILPGGSCHKSEECTAHSTCIDFTCTCPPEKTIVDGICVDKECSESQIRLGGQCVDRSDIGQACKSSLQCVANSRCISGRCDCTKEEIIEGNKCVKKKEEVEVEIVHLDLCPEKSQRAYMEDNSKTLKYCSQLKDCPGNYTCQYSEKVKENICCTMLEKEKKENKNMAKSVIHCPAGMSPYLLNGQPKSCATGSCPNGYQCKFSALRKDYYCCSKQTKKTPTIYHKNGGGCARGSVLLYPSTQEPVLCNPDSKGCPSGYLCLPHTSSKVHQCCSVEAVRDPRRKEKHNIDNVEINCPSYMFKLEKGANGNKTSICVRICPDTFTAVNGFCRQKA